jgi:hypothetical protein
MDKLYALSCHVENSSYSMDLDGADFDCLLLQIGPVFRNKHSTGADLADVPINCGYMFAYSFLKTLLYFRSRGFETLMPQV